MNNSLSADQFKKIGDFIRYLREERGWDKADLVHAIRNHEFKLYARTQNVNNWENKGHRVGTAYNEVLLNIFGIQKRVDGDFITLKPEYFAIWRALREKHSEQDGRKANCGQKNTVSGKAAGKKQEFLPAARDYFFETGTLAKPDDIAILLENEAVRGGVGFRPDEDTLEGGAFYLYDGFELCIWGPAGWSLLLLLNEPEGMSCDCLVPDSNQPVFPDTECIVIPDKGPILEFIEPVGQYHWIAVMTKTPLPGKLWHDIVRIDTAPRLFMKGIADLIKYLQQTPAEEWRIRYLPFHILRRR